MPYVQEEKRRPIKTQAASVRLMAKHFDSESVELVAQLQIFRFANILCLAIPISNSAHREACRRAGAID